MKLQTNAVNVLERTSAYLRSGLLKETPAWYQVVASVPPTTKFTREARFINPSTGQKTVQWKEFDEGVDHKGFYKTRNNSFDRKPMDNRLYKAPKLRFLEDQLREVFYQQHPWEFSRPKMLIENEIHENFDWCHMSQLGKPLDGESVVQRTIYLLQKNPELGMIGAYDKARFEFYRLRMQEEIEQQVAQEEAEMFGSVFSSSALDYGVEQEQRVIDVWKKKALEETELLTARRASPSDSWGQEKQEAEPKRTGEDQETEELHL
ncbi:mitochondrial ribosomal small subunit component [Zygosaccharomyces mellis]|uniref:37S ribosomal protein S25, mitochondrial n=1 Tax=Zygosaccharomyces mellis TaxID=42258 RepID=A0A4C2E2W1_9SACH|nr:mitochondrial ribosomal small subunit component [Zygosaccharomyces mellis]